MPLTPYLPRGVSLEALVLQARALVLRHQQMLNKRLPEEWSSQGTRANQPPLLYHTWFLCFLVPMCAHTWHSASSSFPHKVHLYSPN